MIFALPVRAALVTMSLALGGAFAAGCGSSDEVSGRPLSFQLTDAGCVPHDATIAAGEIAFQVENAGTSAVTEFEVLDGDEILGEKEDLSEGLSGGFSLTLEPGSYTLYCPGGDRERGTLTVTGR